MSKFFFLNSYRLTPENNDRKVKSYFFVPQKRPEDKTEELVPGLEDSGHWYCLTFASYLEMPGRITDAENKCVWSGTFGTGMLEL